MYLLQPDNIEVESIDDEEEEVEQDLLEWGEIFGLLEGMDEMDVEEHGKVVDGKSIQGGYHKTDGGVEAAG